MPLPAVEQVVQDLPLHCQLQRQSVVAVLVVVVLLVLLIVQDLKDLMVIVMGHLFLVPLRQLGLLADLVEELPLQVPLVMVPVVEELQITEVALHQVVVGLVILSQKRISQNLDKNVKGKT
jgi:hypothetical protein